VVCEIISRKRAAGGVYAVLCTARPLDAGEVQPRHYTWLVATSLGDRRRLGLRHSLSGAMANCYVFLRS